MFSIFAVSFFIDALPISLRSFYAFFFSLLSLPLFVSEGGGLPVVESTASSPPVVPSIAGPLADLSANSLPFSIAIVCADNAGKIRSTGSALLFDQPGILNLASGRASCAISGPLNVSMIVTPKDDITVPMLSLAGAVAVIPNFSPQRLPTLTIPEIAQLPGSSPLLVTMMGSSSSTLSIPPGIQTDVLINQVIGRNPRLVYAFTQINAGTVTMVVQGRVVVSGLGYPGGFF